MRGDDSVTGLTPQKIVKILFGHEEGSGRQSVGLSRRGGEHEALRACCFPNDMSRLKAFSRRAKGERSRQIYLGLSGNLGKGNTPFGIDAIRWRSVDQDTGTAAVKHGCGHIPFLQKLSHRIERRALADRPQIEPPFPAQFGDIWLIGIQRHYGTGFVRGRGRKITKMMGNRLVLRGQGRISGERVERAVAGCGDLQRYQQAMVSDVIDSNHLALGGPVDPGDIAAFAIETQLILQAVE